MRRSLVDPNRIWRSVRWGGTVEVFLLDTRGERLPSTRQSSQPVYLSPAQMDWLKDGLEASDAVFKLIAHGGPISENADDDEEDGWPGYAAAREEILSHIHYGNIPGVLWVAGDVHYGAVGRVGTSGPGSNLIEVLGGPIVQTPNVLGAGNASLFHGDQFDWVGANNGYAELEFQPASGQVVVRMWNDSGSLLNSQTYQIA
jgi:alkaline phosphatase D